MGFPHHLPLKVERETREFLSKGMGLCFSFLREVGNTIIDESTTYGF
jgi:hypothetical protein